MRPSLPPRAREAGFTLIETLVALTVLATAAVALMGATQAQVVRIAGLEQRAAAQWVGENAIAEVALGMNISQAPAAMMGYDFTMTLDRVSTSNPSIEQVTVQVIGTEGAVMSRVVGFVLLPERARPTLP